MTPEVPPDPVRVAVAFTSLLERLGIAYVVGGSFASSVHGEPRSTNDVDVVADLTASHIPLLQSALNSTYT